MTKIKEITGAIHTQFGGMFDKTLEAIVNRRNKMSESFKEINSQMEQTSSSIVEATLKEIGTARKKKKDKIQNIVKKQMDFVKELEKKWRILYIQQ